MITFNIIFSFLKNSRIFSWTQGYKDENWTYSGPLTVMYGYKQKDYVGVLGTCSDISRWLLFLHPAACTVDGSLDQGQSHQPSIMDRDLGSKHLSMS